jgi:hypothetical protein
MPTQVIQTSDLLRRQSLEATIFRACGSCGAPPTYKSHESIRDGWPGCYVEPGDPLDNQLVGDICPNCGAKQLSPEPRGEIWAREWRVARFNFWSWLKGLFA